jgi:hypothetical protein
LGYLLFLNIDLAAGFRLRSHCQFGTGVGMAKSVLFTAFEGFSRRWDSGIVPSRASLVPGSDRLFDIASSD